MENAIEIAHADELRPGECKSLIAGNIRIALFNVDGHFFAVSDTCPHRGGPLGEGELNGEIVTCPWHNWHFNVKSGCNAIDGSRQLQTFATVVENGRIKLFLDKKVVD